MRATHEDKAGAPAPYVGADEFRADFAAAEAWREANLTPDELAARPTPDERRRLDEALAAWEAARRHREEIDAALAARRAELRHLEGIERVRGFGGTIDDRRRGSDAEIDAAARAIRALEADLVAARAAEERAQVGFNELNAGIGRACTARRVAVQQRQSFEAWAAAHPDASEREVAEAREMYGLARGGLLDWIRVRWGGA